MLNEPILRSYATDLTCDSKTIGGYCVRYYDGTTNSEFHVPSKNYIERIERGAFDEMLASDTDVKLAINHKQDIILGWRSTGELQLRSDNHGVRFEAQYDPEDSDHKYAEIKIRKKRFKGASLRMYVQDDKWTTEGKNRVRTIKKAYFDEVSPCPEPCYKGTSVYVRSENQDEIEKAGKAADVYETNELIEEIRKTMNR